MADDQDLLDRFAPLAEASFAEASPVESLRARAARRRRRRRAWAGGAATALVLAGLGTWAVVTLRAPDRERVATQPAEDLPLSATVGTGPRLVIGWLPEGLPTPECRYLVPTRRELLTCMLDRAAITLDRGAATAEVRTAWDQRDAAALATALGRPAEGAAFTVIDGGPVLALGDGSFVLVAAADVVSVNPQGLSDEQVEQILAGLQTEPEDPGFRLPAGVLPGGAVPVVQGEVHPDVGVADPGTARGITYDLPDAGTQPRIAPLSLTVVRDVDAHTYLADWSGQQDASEPIARGGRSGFLSRRTELLSGAETLPVERVAVAMPIDARSVVLVDAPAAYADHAVAMAASVVLR